jgi:hypothetical protein
MIARGSDSPNPARPVTGRHVLGSSPESLEPVNPASLPSLPAPDGAQRAEPQRTIYVRSWGDARRRVEMVAPQTRPALLAALNHVETGWEHVRELQRWYDDNREHAQGDDDYALILSFIDGDVVDVYREIAAEVAALVPGYPGWKNNADPGAIDGDLDVFRRYFRVFALAVEQAPETEPVRELVRRAARGLAGWCTELAILVAAIDSTVLRPALSDCDPFDFRRNHA